ncbi:MAG TPA: PadR family transcriptional regulator [Candidatus Lustribacter sp.]
MGHKFGGRGMGREDMMGGWRGGGRARRGDIKFLILEVLAEGPRHGYDIITELDNKSNGRYRPSPGSVYPTLTLLEEGGYLTGDTADGKRVFTITERGRELLTKKPAEAASEDDDGIDLRGSAMKLGAAVMQTARAGDAATQQQVREILDTARREIYKLLAVSE